MPATLSVGGHQPLNNFADLLRQEIARGGYTEMLTHGLCSRDENFKVQDKRQTCKLSGTANLRDRDNCRPLGVCFRFGS